MGMKAMTQRHFSAGAGRVDITPPLTAPIAGWGAQRHVLPDGVEQKLVATVLVVADGHETAAFVELELVVISRAESAAIQHAVARNSGFTPRRCARRFHTTTTDRRRAPGTGPLRASTR